MKMRLFPLVAWFCACLLVPAGAGVHAHYSFDSDFTDDSGNGNHGVLTEVGTGGGSGITMTAGDFVFGVGAMNFSAERDYLAVPSRTFSSGVAYTVSFWARKAAGDTGDPAQWDMVIGERDGTSFFIGLNDATGTGSRTGLRWRSSSTAVERNADFTASDDTDWHHYALVASGTTISLYIDGGPAVTETGKSTGFIIDTIGEAYSTSRDFDFHGLIDEMWIFDEALDATEVSNLYNFNSTIPESSAVMLGTLAGLLLLRRRR